MLGKKIMHSQAIYNGRCEKPIIILMCSLLYIMESCFHHEKKKIKTGCDYFTIAIAR